MRYVPVAFVLIALDIVPACSYTPGAKSYWDSKLEELCQKEGSVQVLGQVAITKDQAAKMRDVDGRIALRMYLGNAIDEPVYAAVQKTAHLREGNPAVRRTEVAAIRRADGEVVARWVQYARVGGDPQMGMAHESSFLCPKPHLLAAQLQALFIFKD